MLRRAPEAQIAMSPTQTGRFLALGETIVRTHLNSTLLPSHPPCVALTFSVFGYRLLSSLHLFYTLDNSASPALAFLGPPLTWPQRFVEQRELTTIPSPTTNITHRSSYRSVFDHSDICDCEGYYLVCTRCVNAAPHPVPKTSLVDSIPIPPSPAPKVGRTRLANRPLSIQNSSNLSSS